MTARAGLALLASLALLGLSCGRSFVPQRLEGVNHKRTQRLYRERESGLKRRRNEGWRARLQKIDNRQVRTHLGGLVAQGAGTARAELALVTDTPALNRMIG